jgi:hypothetical protein
VPAERDSRKAAHAAAFTLCGPVSRRLPIVGIGNCPPSVQSTSLSAFFGGATHSGHCVPDDKREMRPGMVIAPLSPRRPPPCPLWHGLCLPTPLGFELRRRLLRIGRCMLLPPINRRGVPSIMEIERQSPCPAAVAYSASLVVCCRPGYFSL